MVMGDCFFLQTASYKYFIDPSSTEKITGTIIFLCVHLQDLHTLAHLLGATEPVNQIVSTWLAYPPLTAMPSVTGFRSACGCSTQQGVPFGRRSCNQISSTDSNWENNAMSSEARTDQCQSNSVKRAPVRKDESLDLPMCDVKLPLGGV